MLDQPSDVVLPSFKGLRIPQVQSRSKALGFRTLQGTERIGGHSLARNTRLLIILCNW